MPILTHAPDLPSNHELNKAVDQYNLTSHDNNKQRIVALKKVLNAFKHLQTGIQTRLNHWVEDANGLASHAHSYGIYQLESNDPAKRTTTFWKNKDNNPSKDADEAVLKKPRH